MKDTITKHQTAMTVKEEGNKVVLYITENFGKTWLEMDSADLAQKKVIIKSAKDTCKQMGVKYLK